VLPNRHNTDRRTNVVKIAIKEDTYKMINLFFYC